MFYIPVDVWTPVEQAARRQLENALAVVRSRLPAAEAVLTNGPAAAEVVAVADRVKADLIVMGTHGRQGVGRMFLGSVAERVVRSSPVPVLTIRARKHAQASMPEATGPVGASRSPA